MLHLRVEKCTPVCDEKHISRVEYEAWGNWPEPVRSKENETYFFRAGAWVRKVICISLSDLK